VLCSTTFQRFRAGGRCLSGPDYVSTFRDDAVRGALTFRRFATTSSQIGSNGTSSEMRGSLGSWSGCFRARKGIATDWPSRVVKTVAGLSHVR
jgi:hypothetical protein